MGVVDVCNKAFKSYIGLSFGTSRYFWDSIEPKATDWNDGYRGLYCVAWSPTGVTGDITPSTIYGSIKDSHR